MTSIGKWNTPGAITTIFSSMTPVNGAMTAYSATYDNSFNLDLYVSFEVNLLAFSPSANPFVSVYGVSSLDGVNFPAQSDVDLRLTTTAQLAIIPIGTTASTAQRVVSGPILLAPTKWQFKLDNQTGATLVANSTLKILPYNYNLNG